MEPEITADILRNLPMTVLETHLKHCLHSYPGYQSKVFLSDEIPAYFQRMSAQYGSQVQQIIAQDNLASVIRSGVIGNASSRLRMDPNDKTVLQDIAALYTNPSESLFFAEREDITASLALRYLPPNWECNDFFEVYYVFSGECPMLFQQESMLLQPGTVLLVPPSTQRAYRCTQDDCVLFFCKIRASTFSKVFWSHLTSQNLMSYFFRQALSGHNSISYLKFNIDQDPEIERILCALYNEYRKQGIYRAKILNTLMSLFFLRLLTDYEGTAQLSRKSDFLWKPEYLSMFQYIQNHFASITLEELAKKYNYSDRQVIRIIQNCTGMTLTQLLTKLRMERAADLITAQAIPFTRIATEVGYSTLSSFYRAFSQYYQCTPKDYLIRHRQYSHEDM